MAFRSFLNMVSVVQWQDQGVWYATMISHGGGFDQDDFIKVLGCGIFVSQPRFLTSFRFKVNGLSRLALGSV